ncbi:hypothetical protein TNCV_4844211 [Trichonephila clavipes]|uniref:Uncharacterized protein n=1 Tax=Trichonephila clavipes TaxID=2585209 RepID=A0A8X7BMX6_TRICX|nr:hypothetical protein TNCV_4844211 [Trichonephila clavipes]
MISTQNPESTKAWDVVWCLNSQYRAIMRRADHQHIFSPLIGVGKNHLYGWSYKVVTPNCLGGPQVDCDRLNTHPGFIGR